MDPLLVFGVHIATTVHPHWGELCEGVKERWVASGGGSRGHELVTQHPHLSLVHLPLSLQRLCQHSTKQHFKVSPLYHLISNQFCEKKTNLSGSLRLLNDTGFYACFDEIIRQTI